MSGPSRQRSGKDRRRAFQSKSPVVSQKQADARSISFEALVAIEERPVFLRVVLDDLCRDLGVLPRDRALALEIAAGVTRRRATLDAVLSPHIRAPEGRIEPRLRTVLRMGAYQLLFLATPPHAAVFEMVELARRHQPRWTGMVNAVLRAVQRDMTETFTTTPGPQGVPVCTQTPEFGCRIEHRQLQSSVFASPETEFARYVAAAFSLPGWLAERWATRFEREELLRIAAWFATPGRMSLRVNPLRTTTAAVLQSLNEAGIIAAAGETAGAIRLLESTRVDSLPGFSEGLFSVQDESAMAAAALLDPQPGERVLDLCAAPGGKSAALAERMRNQGQVIAADADAKRVALIGPGAARLGLTIVEPVVVSPDSSDVPSGPFERILLDAPCSNTGVLGKRPEARWRISPSGIGELAKVQVSLLRAAIDRLAAGGKLVYSTCSIEPEENEQVVRQVLTERPHVRLVSERQLRPGEPTDGGYQALMVDGR